jgi:hypothetical protein
MKNLFTCKARDAIVPDHAMCPGNIAWRFVGGALLLAIIVLIVREVPAIVRELRIMRM